MKRNHKSNNTGMNLKFFLSIIVLPALFNAGFSNLPVRSNDEDLNLTDSGRKIENTINLFTSRSNYEDIKTSVGVKTNVKAEVLIINGDTLEPEGIITRGQTTLYLRRKSLSFKLNSKASFRHGERTESLKKFFALSITMDRNYCNNRLAFEMMETCRIFDLFYSFCELRINGQSEGIYMVIERPEDWAMRKKNSPLFMRRGYEHNIDKIETDKKIGKDEARKYISYFRQIYSSLNKYEGEELYKTLSNWLDLDAYMKWLAFNFFVRNGDYTDEVYFYIDRDINKLSIIPWDYDDLFASAPHEGNIVNKKILGDKFIFSAEDMLDKKIAADPYMYKMYLIQFREVLHELSPAVLKRIFESTYAELYPYYSNSEIMSMSGYDIYKDANLPRLKSDMLALYDNLRITRDLYLNSLGEL
jgi:spore coat protein H